MRPPITACENTHKIYKYGYCTHLRKPLKVNELRPIFIRPKLGHYSVTVILVKYKWTPCERRALRARC